MNASVPLVPPDNPLAVTAALFAIASLAFLAERTRIGAQVTGAVWAILFAIAASNLGLIPRASPGYDFVFTYFVPMLIPLFLIQADLRKIFFETTRMTAAFTLAAAGTVLGVMIAFALIDVGNYAPGVQAIDMGSRQAATAGAFTATYIGGSVNYAALVEVTQLAQADPSFVTAATAVDNLCGALFLALLAVLPGWHWLARRFLARDHHVGAAQQPVAGQVDAASMMYAATFALIIVVLGDWLTGWLRLAFGDWAGNWRYAVITVLALIPATAWPRHMTRLHGGQALGVALSFVFFAALAAGADVMELLRQAPLLLLAVVLLLAVHAVVTFGLGRVLRFSLPELITASNAAILGATTAPALAATKGWKDLVTPGVLVGVFGYALGTILGTLVYQFWPG